MKPIPPRLAYTVNDALATGAFSSRNKFYSAVARGELVTFLDGKRRMVSDEALRDYIVRRERNTTESVVMRSRPPNERAI